MWTVVLLAAQLAAGPLTVELGPSNVSHGLRVPSAGDGANEPVERAGRPARTNSTGSRYMYVVVEDPALPPGDHDVYLTADLFDDGLRAVAVEYEKVAAEPSLATRYSMAEEAMLLVGSGQWVTRCVRLPHARLGHGQNQGASLRLAGNCVVSRLSLSTERPADYRPGGVIGQAELEQMRAKLPPGQELTIGCDPDQVTAQLLSVLGATAVESYVTWQTVEDAGRGHWDWSRWDRQVDILERAGLKWVPFLIAGPAYATPRWFREGPDHLGYINLDNDRETLIESLWNPALKPEIDRFISAFWQRYGHRGVIQSILLGVTGTYGESIYPAGPEGGWTTGITGPYYNGVGWWAGDPQARAAFRAAMARRYQRIERLNQAWGTTYASFEAVQPFAPSKAPSEVARADFGRWYTDAMTEWSRWWVATTRRIVGDTPIMLCTGGAGEPALGADFTAQAKAIAPYGAGIRITNEGSNYPLNFSVTREVATATRLYGTFCGFEPAGEVNAQGVPARIYNATASGARELHYYQPNLFDTPEATASFRANLSHLRPRTPQRPPVAVYMAREHWMMGGSMNDSYATVRALRDLYDLDLVTRDSVNDGVLDAAQLLIIPTAGPTEAEPAITRFVRRGGSVVRAATDVTGEVATVTVDGAAPARWRLDVGAPGDEAFLDGDWNDPEDSRSFPDPLRTKRWSGAAPVIWLPLEPGRPTEISLEAIVSQHSLSDGAKVTVSLDGRPLGELREGYQLARYSVPGEAIRQPVGRLAIALKPWRPSEHGQGDGRLLGVAISRVEVVAPGATAPWVVNRGLSARFDAARARRTADGQGQRWDLPPSAVRGRNSRLWPSLVASVAPELAGGPDGQFDQVYCTDLAHGRLWLNMTDAPVERDGVTVPAFGIAEVALGSGK